MSRTDDICPQWKVLVLDESSRKLVYNTAKDDDILNLNVTSKPALSVCRGNLIRQRAK